MKTTRPIWRAMRHGRAVVTALCLALASLLAPASALPAGAARAAAASVAAETPAPGTARIVLRHRADAPALDVEVTSMAQGPWRTFGPQSLAPGEEMTVDLGLWQNGQFPTGYQPGRVQVEAWLSGARYQFLSVLEFVAVESEQLLVLDITGPVPGARAPAAQCPPSDPAPPAGTAALAADLDGDGDDEQVVLWSDSAGGTTTWRLGATGLGAGHAVATVTPTSPGVEPALMGATDVNDQPGEEVFVATGRDGPLEQFQMWGLDGCTLKVATGEDGNAMTLRVGSSETHRAGVLSQYNDLAAELAQWLGAGEGHTFTSYHWNGLVLQYRGGPIGGTGEISGESTDTETWVVNHASNLRVGVPDLRLLTPEGQRPQLPAAPAPAAPPPAVVVSPAYTG